MTPGHLGQIATVFLICIVIAVVLFVAGLAEIHHAIERERLQRGRDDHDEAVRADMASMPGIIAQLSRTPDDGAHWV